MKAKKSPYFYLLWCATLLCVSCNTGSKNKTFDTVNTVAVRVPHGDGELVVCDLLQVKDTLNLPLSSILSSFEVVRLDNSEEALTKADGYVFLSDNYIGVTAYQVPYKLYDRSGKYLRNIGGYGQGPFEYRSIYDSYIDEANNRIYIVSYIAKKIPVFDLAGNPVEIIPLPFTVPKSRIKVDTQKRELLVMALPFAETPYVIWKQDFEGNVLQYINAGQFVVDPADYSNEVDCSWNTGELDYSLFRWVPQNDSLYHYNPEKNELHPVFTTKFGDKVERHSYMELPGYYVTWLIEPATLTYTPYTLKVYVDKKTLRGAYVNWTIDQLGNIVGPSWTPLKDGYYVANMYPHDLKKQLGDVMLKSSFMNVDTETKKRIIDLNNSITDDDNNILLIGKLKAYE